MFGNLFEIHNIGTYGERKPKVDIWAVEILGNN